jgi:hypothetical protein
MQWRAAGLGVLTASLSVFKRRWSFCAVVILGIALVTTESLAAQRVVGFVFFTNNDAPVSLATVRLIDARGDVVATELTEPDGKFSIQAPVDGEFLSKATARR